MGIGESLRAGFAAAPLDFPLSDPTSTLQSLPFSNLSTLRIIVGFQRDLIDEKGRERFCVRPTTFMARAPTLHTLGLTFGPIYRTESQLTVPKGECKSLLIQELTLSSSLKNVKIFEFGGMSTCLSLLTKAFAPLRNTLHELKMSYVLLWDCAWIEWIEWLRDNVINLEDLDIDFARENSPPPAYHNGSGMKKFIDDTANEWASLINMECFDEYSDSYYEESDYAYNYSDDPDIGF